MPHEIKDLDFEKEVIKSDLPVVVDFWAPWCGPCKMVAPIVESIAKKFEGKVKFVKLNIDENPEMAAKFGIMSVPTFLMFKAGKVVEQAVGAMLEDVLKARIEKLL